MGIKLICLNAWGGRAFDPLMSFVRAHASDADVFCFQETFVTRSDIEVYKGIRVNLVAELQRALPDFDFIFTAMMSGAVTRRERVDFDVSFGLATFVRSSIGIQSHGETLIMREVLPEAIEGDNVPCSRFLQHVALRVPGRDLLIGNFHGIPWPGSKLDSDNRLVQSRALLAFLREQRGEIVLCGDFNLLPSTESIGMLEQDLRNLITELGITSTRSRLNEFYGTPAEQPFADYVFVSPATDVTGFSVPDVDVSDHRPMILDLT